MMGLVKLLGIIGGAFNRLWDFFMSPRKQKERADREADKPIVTHDPKTANEILDRKLGP